LSSKITTMPSYQTAKEYALNEMQIGNIDAAQANVLMVQMMGVRVIKSRIPSDVRKALNGAVKKGELGHMKKDGLKPEVYYHKNARAEAIVQREREMRSILGTLKNVFVHARDL
jgi:hypothetical protein